MSARETPDAARAWVDQLLAAVRTREPSPERVRLMAEATTLPAAMQVGVLRECVQRMPAFRAGDDRAAYEAGSALYQVACRLYGRKLPLEESDVCALLLTSRHTCGHGADVAPPLDVARAYMQKHGFSEPVIAASREFIEGLRGVGSSQAQFAKRRAAIMLLADPQETPEAESGWAAHFRAGLRDLPAAERGEWQRLILEMKANDVYLPPAVWQKPAQRLLAALSPQVVLGHIDRWIPLDGHRTSATVRTGGSHLLKHLVWLLDALSTEEEEELLPACDALIGRLAAVDWTPKDRAAKFMIAAAYSASRRPPEVAWAPLQQLLQWSGQDSRKIGKVVREYAAQHGLSRPEPAPPPSRLKRWIAALFRRGRG
jgi:hypothetical protein